MESGGGRFPKDPMTLTPKEFEETVAEWLRAAWDGHGTIRVSHRDTRQGLAGDYEIDVTVEFEAFEGAAFVVLVECKRHSENVKRDMVMMTLKAKKDDLGAHKAMMFSTAGFQSGAIVYAEKHGIATVQVQDGGSAYITKAMTPRRELPPWAPVIVGWITRPGDEPNKRVLANFSTDSPDALTGYLMEATPAVGVDR